MLIKSDYLIYLRLINYLILKVYMYRHEVFIYTLRDIYRRVYYMYITCIYTIIMNIDASAIKHIHTYYYTLLYTLLYNVIYDIVEYIHILVRFTVYIHLYTAQHTHTTTLT